MENKTFKNGDICIVTGNGTGVFWGDGKLKHLYGHGDCVIIDYSNKRECLVYSPKGIQFIDKIHLWNTGLSINNHEL